MDSARKLYRPSWAAWLALSAHIVWLVIFVYIIWVGPSGRDVATLFGNVWIPHCEVCDRTTDSIKSAHDLGRLDQVSLALTVLGVSLAVMAFAGFFVVRAAAMHAAREEARETTSALLPMLLTPQIVAKALEADPRLPLSALSKLAPFRPDVRGSDADRIAEVASAGDENGGDDG